MIDQKELAAIRDRDATQNAAMLCGQSRADRRALLAHIDALAEAVEGVDSCGEDHIHRSVVLAILRGDA